MGTLAMQTDMIQDEVIWVISNSIFHMMMVQCHALGPITNIHQISWHHLLHQAGPMFGIMSKDGKVD